MFAFGFKKRKEQFLQAVHKNDIIAAKSLIVREKRLAASRCENVHEEMLDLLIASNFARDRTLVS
jgi:iron uptake system EfeUOB component EfeO/EfeM